MKDHTMCTHSRSIRSVRPKTLGCEECLAEGMTWFHLRVCRECGHVGCCDQSQGRHATAHFHHTGHAVIEGYDPPEGWGWCYIDEEFVELPDQSPRLGPIPRYY
nr:UBP-type zinc finger domain-containing protein [Neorhizobium alkalisoli]